MPFEKGRAKTGGRVPGVKNKTTEEIKQKIQLVLANKVEELADDLAMMPEHKQWQILSAIARYVLPSKVENEGSVEHSGEVKYNVNINFVDAHSDPSGDNNNEG
jgi:septum formation topological specificity factor MinE